MTVSRDAAGRWHVSLLVETTVHDGPPTACGGRPRRRDHLAGHTVHRGEDRQPAPRTDATATRLARAQRELARKQRGSANREKARRTVARVHARITDRRRDHLHKLSTRLIRENQAVVIEDLAVQQHARATTRWPARSRMRGGGSCGACWSTSAGGTAATWWWSTAGSRRRRCCSACGDAARRAAAEHAEVDVPLRHDPRPGRERGDQRESGRACRVGLWRWCKTRTRGSASGQRSLKQEPSRVTGRILVLQGGE